MNILRKMILVPVNNEMTIEKKQTDLDNSMSKILNRTDLNIYDKVKLYNSILSRYLNFNKTEKHDGMDFKKEDEPMVEPSLLHLIPSPIKNEIKQPTPNKLENKEIISKAEPQTEIKNKFVYSPNVHSSDKIKRILDFEALDNNFFNNDVEMLNESALEKANSSKPSLLPQLKSSVKKNKSEKSSSLTVPSSLSLAKDRYGPYSMRVIPSTVYNEVKAAKQAWNNIKYKV